MKIRIESLTTTSGVLKGAQLEFADGLTCVTQGIDSTVVDTLRFALGRPPERGPRPREDGLRLVRDLERQSLEGGTARVELSIDGRPVILERSARERTPRLAGAEALDPSVLDRIEVYGESALERIASEELPRLDFLDMTIRTRLKPLLARRRRIGLGLVGLAAERRYVEERGLERTARGLARLYDSYRREREDLSRQIFEIRKARLDELAKRSKDLALRLTPGGSRDEYQKLVARALERSVRGRRDLDPAKLSSEIAAHLTPDELCLWVEGGEGSEAIRQRLETALGRAKDSFLGALDALSPWADLDAFRALALDDRFEIDYCQGGARRPIAQWSSGETSCALLPLVLAPGSGPLVVHRPERRIAPRDVRRILVPLLRRVAAERQVIVTTDSLAVCEEAGADHVIMLPVDEDDDEVPRVGTPVTLQSELEERLDPGRLARQAVYDGVDSEKWGETWTPEDDEPDRAED